MGTWGESRERGCSHSLPLGDPCSADLLPQGHCSGLRSQSSSQRPSQAATTPGGSKSYFPSSQQSPASAFSLFIQVLVSLPPK